MICHAKPAWQPRDMQFDDNNAWSSEALKAQTQYLNAVNQYFVTLQAQDQPASQPESIFFQQLNQAAAAVFTREAFPVFSNLLLQSDKVNAFYQHVGKFFHDLKRQEQPTIDSAVDQFCDYMAQQWQPLNQGVMWHLGFACAIHPLQNYWQEFVHSVCVHDLDQDFERQLAELTNHKTISGQVMDELHTLLDLWREYSRAFTAYEASLTGAGRLAVQKFRQALVELFTSDGQIERVKTLYHLWIDCHAHAYQEIVFTDQHAKAFAAMINSFMRLKRELNQLSEDAAKLFTAADQIKPASLLEQQDAAEADPQPPEHASTANQLDIDDLTSELDELKNFMQTSGSHLADEQDKG